MQLIKAEPHGSALSIYESKLLCYAVVRLSFKS